MGYTIGEIYSQEIKENLKLLNIMLPPFVINPLWKNLGYQAKTILLEIKKYSWDKVSKKKQRRITRNFRWV